MFRNLKKKTKKNFNWKIKSKIIFFWLPQFHYCPLNPYISKSTNHFEKNLHLQIDFKE